MTDTTVRTLERVLEYAASAVGVEPVPGAAAHASEACEASADPITFLESAASLTGLIALRVRTTGREAARAAGRGVSRFAIRLRNDELEEVIAIAEVRRGQVRVLRFTESTDIQWLSLGEFSELTADAQWVGFEAGSTADAHSSHDEEHGHGDHEHHGIPPSRRLLDLLRSERQDLWVAVIYSVLIGLLMLVVPIATQSIVNTIAFGTVLQPLVVLTVAVLVALGFATILQGLRAWVVELIQQRVFVRMAGAVVHRVVRVRADAFDRHHGPELMNRFLEVVTVQKAGSMLLVDGLSIFMQTLIGMGLLAVYHPWLLAFAAFLLVAIAIVLFGLSRGAVRTSIRESRAKYALVAWLEEVSRNLITFKSAAGANLAVQRTDALVQRYLVERNSHFRILLRQILGSLTLQAVATAALLGVGGWLVIDRQLTLGQLIAAEIVVGAVVTGFSKFGKQLEVFYDLQAALDKLGHLTDLPLEDAGGEKLKREPAGARVALRDVTYGYSSRAVLQSISWKIEAGRRIGLLGGGGGGKSTLLDLLYGLRQPRTGVVEIDGHDYREIRPGDLRSHVVLVRDAEVFEGTVADNVRLGNPSITSAGVRRALEAAGILDAVLALPLGIRTKLSTGGLPLSPSQAMRLVLARAFAARPRLLLIDEALDAIDDLRPYGTVCNSLFDPEAPWTLVIATENKEVLERCDEWHRLADGRLQPGSPMQVASLS